MAGKVFFSATMSLDGFMAPEAVPGAGTSWRDPAEDQDRVAAARRCAAALGQYASGAYVSFVNDDGPEAVLRGVLSAQASPADGGEDRLRPGRSERVMRRLGQAASRSQVLRCQGCSGAEKAILATTRP